MNKFIILTCLLFLTLAGFTAGYYVMFDYEFSNTYTSAVCSGNMCQDYEFTCLNGEIISSRAISGFLVLDENWVDLRTEEDRC